MKSYTEVSVFLLKFFTHNINIYIYSLSLIWIQLIIIDVCTTKLCILVSNVFRCLEKQKLIGHHECTKTCSWIIYFTANNLTTSAYSFYLLKRSNPYLVWDKKKEKSKYLHRLRKVHLKILYYIFIGGLLTFIKTGDVVRFHWVVLHGLGRYPYWEDVPLTSFNVQRCWNNSTRFVAFLSEEVDVPVTSVHIVRSH